MRQGIFYRRRGAEKRGKSKTGDESERGLRGLSSWYDGHFFHLGDPRQMILRIARLAMFLFAQLVDLCTSLPITNSDTDKGSQTCLIMVLLLLPLMCNVCQLAGDSAAVL